MANIFCSSSWKWLDKYCGVLVFVLSSTNLECDASISKFGTQQHQRCNCWWASLERDSRQAQARAGRWWTRGQRRKVGFNAFTWERRTEVRKPRPGSRNDEPPLPTKLKGHYDSWTVWKEGRPQTIHCTRRRPTARRPLSFPPSCLSGLN